MRKIILTAVLFISMGTMAFAQQDKSNKVRKTPEERAQHLTDALDKKLALSADQKSKVYAITFDGLKKWKENRTEGQKPDRAVMKAELEKRDAQISAVLNDQQKKTYQEWKAEKMKSMKKHGKRGAKNEKV